MINYYNRRHLLKLMSLAIGGGIFACANPKALSKEHQDRILVIGAGIAGLAAARALAEQGIRTTILEGRSRIGGRIHTDRSLNNIPLDLGASWIHGIEDNPIYELAKSTNIRTLKTAYTEIQLYGNGKFLSDQEKEAIDQQLAKVLRATAKVREQRTNQEQADISLKFALEQVINSKNLQFSSQKLQELNYAINTAIEHEFAADAGDLSLYHWDHSNAVKGEDVLFPDGYEQIINLIAEGLDIKLNQIVKNITYNSQEVIVTTNQGSFTADKAIITLPLGVLKQGNLEFVPSLPDRKIKAIQSLGMGTLNKVYLQFPNVFWDQEAHLLGSISNNKGEWAEWLNIYFYTQQPILLGFNAGSYGKAIESLSDQGIVAGAMQTLQQMYGSKIPNPTGYLVTRWQQDPFSYGSYSYMATGSTPNDRQALAESVNSRLFFAGEATSQNYPSTVHGAFLSGVEVAQMVVLNR